MDRYPGGQFPYAAFFWPALVAASAAETASSMAAQLLEFAPGAADARTAQEPDGATPGKIALELDSVRLRDFTTAERGVPTLLCTPLALHGAAVADLAPGHSLVETLRNAGIERLFMADWRSASVDMRSLESTSIWQPSMCSSMNSAAGSILSGFARAAGYPWSMPTIPGKGTQARHGRGAGHLAAQQCGLSAVAEATPVNVFQGLVSSGNGLVVGRNIAKFWEILPTPTIFMRHCRATHPIGSPEFTRLQAIFRNWNSWTIDVPGKYYLEVVEKLYKRNELARGSFVALGKGSTSRGCGFRSICLPAATTTWSPRNKCLPRSGLWELEPEALSPSGRAVQSSKPVHGKTDARRVLARDRALDEGS